MTYVSAALRPNAKNDETEKRDDARLVESGRALEAQGYKVGFFWVPVQKVPALAREIERLQKRTKRLGLKPIVFEQGAAYETNVPSTVVRVGEMGVWNETTRIGRGKVVPVLVAGEEPRLRGWRLIACLDYDEQQAQGGPWLRVVPGETLPPEFRTVDPTRCDHCMTKRDRSTVFVLAHDDGKYTVVGRTCLVDFLGGHGDPLRTVGAAEMLFAIFDVARGMEDWEGVGGGGSHLARAVDMEDFLAVVVQLIEKYGWISRGEAWNKGTRATADDAWTVCMPQRQIEHSVSKREQPDAKSLEAAKRIVQWATTEFVDKDPTALTDFGYNARTTLIAGIVTQRSAGIIASLASAYQRAETKRAEEQSGGRLDAYYGTVGDRIVLELDMLGAHPVDGAFGRSYLCRFLGTGDAAGYPFKWFGSNWPFDFRVDIAAGQHVRVKATIKRHQEYRGQKETELSRVTPVGPEEPKKPKRTSRPKKPTDGGAPPGEGMQQNPESPLNALRSAMRATEGEDASPEQVAEIERVVDREESDGDRFQINARIQERRASRPAKRVSRPNGTLVAKRTSRPNGKRTSRTGHPGAKRTSQPLWRNRGSGETEDRRLGPGVMGHVEGREVDPDRFKGTRGRAIDEAMDKYEVFHAKKPLDVVDVKHEPPARLVCIGDAHSVSYKTDKWYADGKDIDYKHLHGKSEKVPYEIGKGVMFYENAHLAGPESIRANGTTRPPRAYPKAWTRLGKFQGADLRRNDGEFEEVDARKSAKDCWLLCAPDGKMLAIYSPHQQDDGGEGFLAIMCGGGLRVLKDGIDG
jgi:hypothetical protein